MGLDHGLQKLNQKSLISFFPLVFTRDRQNQLAALGGLVFDQSFFK